MKLIYLTLIFICCAISSDAQKPATFKNDLKREKIKGNVREVTEKEYNAGGDSLKFKAVYKYDDNGNEIDFSTYSEQGATLSKTTFTYNDSGKLLEEKRYKADGTLNVKTTCQYDLKGNKIEEDNYDASGTLFLKVMCKYDGKGNKLVKDSFNEFGILFLKRNMKYDDDGNEISAKEYDSHHGLQFSTTYDYDNTDKAGNWGKRTMYKNDEPFAVTERVIDYR